MSHLTTAQDDVEDGSDEGWSLPVQIIIGVIIMLIALTNIIGNTCTIVAFCKDPKLRVVSNYYICNLAVTDLLIGVSSVPFYAVYTLLDYTWPFGYTFCTTWMVIDFWVCAESTLTILLISYDRLCMVTKGAGYATYATRKRALQLLSISWLLAFLLYSPAIVWFDEWRGFSVVEEQDCDVEFATNVLYTLISSMIEFILPLAVLTAFSLLLYAHILQRTRIQAQSNDDEMTRTLRRNRRAAKNLSLLVTAFLVCWMPYTTATIILAICDSCVNKDVYEMLNWLLWVNSSLNPFLYAYTNERFASYYRKLLCPCSKTTNKVGAVAESSKSTTTN